MMHRRTFIGAVAGGLLTAPLASFAQQQAKVPRIGFLGNSTAALEANLVGPFRDGLRELGYVEDRTIIIEYRWAEGDYERLPALIAELVALKVDAIVQDSGGRTFVLPAGVNTGGSSWAPSLPLVALLNTLGTLNDGKMTVAFRFTPIGLGAAWQIDDLYVDPLKMG